MKTTGRGAGRILAAVVLAAPLLAGCTSGGGSEPAVTGAAAGPADPVREKAALAASSADLRSLVNRLAEPSAVGSAPPFPTCGSDRRAGQPAKPCSGFDGAARCEGGPSGQRWGYNVNVPVGTDATSSGDYVADLLKAEGWKVTEGGVGNITETIATKGGMQVRVVANRPPGLLAIEGYGRCVAPDGSVAVS